ncbi:MULTISPECIES: SDR family oxidoreductase [Pseudoalteromonas]|jgi:2-keto-3-deoxy-L-fuconate dehydrogenase|uniref:SDR family oxidoreductase n=1 Tax=Pseudoalteromonas distincta TaxID=77608 RepID=A0A4P9J3P3_9GAMM|nr:MULTISPECIES: SDR family oxidoreductase [Pseudoalteromonas]MBB1275767.1 SDR family oxidoreductase [Pseudoalteromonas sp. SR43-3]MBB1279675.1 SDR family oxidoreductase [Pseudoalteromonas sp. SR41-1]MBB1348839.1 SDR family oxidoreductase [Pseudoalteromonas sp. SG45-3]MBB1354121.1 SDR family oxidoreductase [Pseudoalteromonas sp. SR45-5]MBB1357787.1 SDR family oxidoreductase [Pseudoalteromonas sp. SG45-6]|tara:strand:- start:30258 stop:30986 length:729 start_codon:yes stop_codon:yes gene_type:complete
MSKVAVVTGGTKGIGLAVVKRLLSNGYKVHNLDIEPSETGIFHQCDVSDVSAVQSCINAICEQSKRIDVLVSNAGKHLSANIESTDEQTLDALFALNVKGAYAAVQSVLPSMKAQNSGAIILVASDQAIIGKQNSFAYNLTKHALASMAKTTALDYASFNIRVNAVCPGTIETPLFHNAIDAYCAKSGANKAEIVAEEASLQPLNRLGQADEVAALVSFLASDDASFITGSLQSIDGGYTAQ